jgi:hypothetical protein
LLLFYLSQTTQMAKEEAMVMRVRIRHTQRNPTPLLNIRHMTN